MKVISKEEMVNSLIEAIQPYKKQLELSDDDLETSYTFAMTNLSTDAVNGIYDSYREFTIYSNNPKEEIDAMLPAFMREINYMLNGK